MKRLFLLILLASAALRADAPPTPTDADNALAGVIDLESYIAHGVSDAISGMAPSVMTFGWTLLGIFGVYALLQTLLQSTLRSLSMHYYVPLASVVAYVAILFRIAIAATMLTFYMNPIPGLGINFHQLFPSLANGLSSAVAMDLVKEVFAWLNDIQSKLPSVGLLQVMPAIIAVIVLTLAALSHLALTVMTMTSHAVVGVLSICGPLLIPFYVLPGQEKRFWNWLDNMLVYSMYRFISAVFVFIWCHAYLALFGSLTSFTVASWLVGIPTLFVVTVSCLFLMFKVPEVAHLVFGGAGGIASGLSNAVQGLVVSGVAAMLA